MRNIGVFFVFLIYYNPSYFLGLYGFRQRPGGRERLGVQGVPLALQIFGTRGETDRLGEG